MLLKKNKAEFLSCNLAGFGHTEGYLVLDEMRAGDKLYMVREDENKYDNNAIALFYAPKHKLPEGTQTYVLSIGTDGSTILSEEDIDVDLAATKTKVQYRTLEVVHVGYIPASSNHELAMMLDYGHQAIFECVICSVNKETHPNQQVHLRVNLLRKK